MKTFQKFWVCCNIKLHKKNQSIRWNQLLKEGPRLLHNHITASEDFWMLSERSYLCNKSPELHQWSGPSLLPAIQKTNHFYLAILLVSAQFKKSLENFWPFPRWLPTTITESNLKATLRADSIAKDVLCSRCHIKVEKNFDKDLVFFAWGEGSGAEDYFLVLLVLPAPAMRSI